MSSVTQLGLTNLNNIDKVSESTYWVNKNFYLGIKEPRMYLTFEKITELTIIWDLEPVHYWIKIRFTNHNLNDQAIKASPFCHVYILDYKITPTAYWHVVFCHCLGFRIIMSFAVELFRKRKTTRILLLCSRIFPCW